MFFDSGEVNMIFKNTQLLLQRIFSWVTGYALRHLSRFSYLMSPVLSLASCILCLSLTQCAQMGEPNGGAADSNPPELLQQKTHPANNSTNFNSSKIDLVFDEYVQVKSQQVVITPALPVKPTIKAKGHKIEVQFNGALEPNTTYTINFSGAVNDITENNVVQNLQYVFSTGPFLDSLSLEGKVVNSFNQNGLSNTTVVLHTNTNDTSISSIKPAYYLKTNKDGSFRFTNLKAGKYSVYAVADKNSDLLFGGHPEEIAFLDSAVNLTNNTGGLKLQQFKPVNTKLILGSTGHVSKWMQVFRYNNAIPNLKAIASNPALTIQTATPNDSVLYACLTDTLVKDSISIQFYSGDSLVDKQNFTAHFSSKVPSGIKAKLSLGAELYVTDSIRIDFNMPYKANQNFITLMDTLRKKNIPFTLTKGLYWLSIIPERQTDKTPLKLVCLPGAFASTVNQSVNDTIMGITTFLPVEKTGNIKLSFKNLPEQQMDSPVCVLLRDGKEIKTQVVPKSTATLEFALLKPGNYTFYLFNDDNRDGRWTTGNFNVKKQPEIIRWYNQPIKVKANWDQDLIWTF